MMNHGKLRGFVIGRKLEWSIFGDSKKELLYLFEIGSPRIRENYVFLVFKILKI